LREKDAQKPITLWKFKLIYIYSTPSIPTTETTHGIYEENVEEAQQEKAQGCEEAGEAPRQKAPCETACEAQDPTCGAEDPSQKASRCLTLLEPIFGSTRV
jgi:hypothetical protein